jgi:multidrug resistance protein, MATE family
MTKVCEGTAVPSFLEAVKKVGLLALPNVFSFLVMMCSSLATIMCFSKANNQSAVAGVGLGGFIFSMFGLAIGLGLSGALDTVVSQAMGTGDYKSASVNLAQARLVTLIAIVPCGIILWMTEPILTLIGQDPVQSRLAGIFIKWQLVGLLPLFWYCALGCFMRACNKTNAPLIANICGSSLHVVASIVCNYMNGMGVEVAGIIAATGNIIRWAVLEGYIQSLLSEEERAICSLPSFIRTMLDKDNSRKLIGGLATFAALAIPSSMMMWSEWFAAELQTLIAGWTDTNYVHSNIELATVTVFAFMIPVGICNTASYLVGSSLGQNEPLVARRYAQASCYLTATVLAVVSTAFYISKDFWTEDDDQRIRAFPYVCAFMWIDGLQTVLEGIIRGCGLQKIAVWVKMICMLVLRIALCFLLCMGLEMGVMGLWLGSTLAMIVSSGIFVVMLYRLDFHERARAISSARESKEATSADMPEPVKIGTPTAPSDV